MSLVSADCDFCSHCGSILPVPQSAPCRLQCLVCKNERTIKESTRLVNRIEFNLERQVIQWDDQDEHLTTVDHTCTKCNHLVATYTTQQTRSADEGQTVFYTCMKCKHRDIEYS